MARTRLTWNGKDAQGNPLRWDTPGLTWDGFVPENEERHMQNIRVLLGLVRAKDHTVEEITGSVLKGMGANTTAYPTPPVTMAELQAGLNDFTASIAAQQQGGKPATINKNNKRDALVAMLRQEAVYVQANCHNDLATLVSSGFEAVTYNHAQTELEKPAIHAVENGNSGQLLVTIKPVAHAKALEVRYAAVGAANALGPWQSGGMFTYSQAMTVNGLSAGTLYHLAVRGIGGSTGYSDWSDSVEHMSM